VGIKERREREREARRGAVLDAARALVRENGFVATTTRGIAKRCELSEATLFWYFKSKDEIFVSLLFEGIASLGSGLAKIEASRASPQRKVARLWKFFEEVRDQNPEYFHVFQYLASPNSAASVTQEVRDEILARSRDNFVCLGRIMEEATSPQDARVAADVLWSCFVGLSVLRDSRVNMGAPAFPGKKELKRAFEMLLRGVLPEQE